MVNIQIQEDEKKAIEILRVIELINEGKEVHEVVRCRDCKDSRLMQNGVLEKRHCSLFGKCMSPEDFCSYGRR